MESRCTRKHRFSEMWGSGIVRFPTRGLEKPFDVFHHNFRTINPIILKLGSFVHKVLQMAKKGEKYFETISSTIPSLLAARGPIVKTP